MTFIQRRLNVDATSGRCIDIEATLYRRDVSDKKQIVYEQTEQRLHIQVEHISLTWSCHWALTDVVLSCDNRMSYQTLCSQNATTTDSKIMQTRNSGRAIDLHILFILFLVDSLLKLRHLLFCLLKYYVKLCNVMSYFNTSYHTDKSKPWQFTGYTRWSTDTHHRLNKTCLYKKTTRNLPTRPTFDEQWQWWWWWW